MNELSEQAFDKLKNLSEICKGADDNPNLKEELIESIRFIQEILNNRTSRLSLHNSKFKIVSPTVETEIESLFEVCYFRYLFNYFITLFSLYLFSLYLFSL